jgi:hypothetical protein
MKENGPGSPFGEPKEQNKTQQNRQREKASAPGNSVTQESIQWQTWSHKQLVKGFQNFIDVRRRRCGGYCSPEEIIRGKLDFESDVHTGSRDEKEKDFYFKLRTAFDVVVYDRYIPGSHEESLAGSLLKMYASSTDGSTTIKLDEAQVKVLDALTEAVGIPHKRGQNEINIPEKFHGRNYYEWLLSEERRELINRAKAAQKNRK